MTYLMEINNLGKRYDDFELSGVSLAVEPGRVVGFIGSNGAGKTTTIKAALGIIAADAGTVRLFGQPVTCGSAEMDAIKSRIGIVLDTCAFPDTCRVCDVGAIGRAAYRELGRRPVRRAVRPLHLAPKKKVSELSRGMGMKLTLAFALSHNPELLVLDEATAGLDPIARDEVLDLLRDFMAEGGRGILMSTHITSDLENDRRRGRLRRCRPHRVYGPQGCHHRRGRRGPLPRRRCDRNHGHRLLCPLARPASCATTTAATCSPPIASPSPAPSPTFRWTRPPSKTT